MCVRASRRRSSVIAASAKSSPHSSNVSRIAVYVNAGSLGRHAPASESRACGERSPRSTIPPGNTYASGTDGDFELRRSMYTSIPSDVSRTTSTVEASRGGWAIVSVRVGACSIAWPSKGPANGPASSSGCQKGPAFTGPFDRWLARAASGFERSAFGGSCGSTRTRLLTVRFTGRMTSWKPVLSFRQRGVRAGNVPGWILRRNVVLPWERKGVPRGPHIVHRSIPSGKRHATAVRLRRRRRSSRKEAGR